MEGRLMAKYGATKDVDQLLQRLAAVGWRVEPQKRHIRMYPPKGEGWERAFYTSPTTTANWHAIKKLRILVRKAEARAKVAA